MQSALGGQTVRDLATDLLRDDHQKVRELFAQYARASREHWDTRRSIAEDISMHLELHSRVEEEIFYPAIERVVPEFAAQARVCHRELDDVIAQLKRDSAELTNYDRAMSALFALFDPHARAEEALFGALEQKIPDALRLLRTKIIRRKEQLAGSTQDMEGRS